MGDSSLKLKEQAQMICTMLYSEFGEQSLFISVNLSNQTSVYLGSPYGKEFLEYRMDIIEQFYNQCSGQQCIVPTEKEKETVTESTSGTIEPESAANQDAKTMTEKLEGPVEPNMVIEPASANENEHLKSKFNSEKVMDKTSSQTSHRLSERKSTSNKLGIKAVDQATVSLDVKTNSPKHVSVEETNTMLSSGDRIITTVLPSGDRIITESQTISNEGYASENDVKQYNNSLGDIFEDEFTDDKKSDPEFMLKDKCTSNQHFQYGLKEITLTDPNLSEESVPPVINLIDGSALRGGSIRRRPKSHLLGNDQNDYYDHEERKTTQTKRRRRRINVQTVPHIPPQEKDRIFDIYNSGQRIIQSVNEVKEQGTEINLPETESLETENVYNINSVKSKEIENKQTEILHSINSVSSKETECWRTEHLSSISRVLSKDIEKENFEKEHFLLLGLKEGGFYINFEDILKQDIRRLMSEEPKQEIEQSSDGRYICHRCGKTFASKDSAMGHIQINHTGETSLKCDICGKLFQRMGNLQSHTMLHEKDPLQIPPPANSPPPMIIEVRSDGRYKCPECDRDFATKNWTEWHVRLKHTGQSPHMCNICNKLFARSDHLENHMLTHNRNIRPFICEVCGKTFQMKKNLEKHVRTHELDGVAPSFKCPYPDCDRVFVTRFRLDKHLRYKQAGRDFVCDKCGFASKKKQGLQNHLDRIHTGYRKPEFHCEQCNKYFHSKANYTVHVNNHKGLARYVCDCCNMAFSSSSTLKRHYLRKAGLYVRHKSKNGKKILF